MVAWRRGETATEFHLVPPDGAGEAILLLRVDTSTDDPRAVAEALAAGLAACDFPPTEPAASASRVAATLRVSGLGHLLD